MLSSAEHLASARRFEDFLAALPRDSPFREIQIIALFYSALHYVEAFLVTKSRSYRNHELRDPEMSRWDATRRVRPVYNRLKKAAHEARYLGTQFRAVDVEDFKQCHAAVRDAILQALNNRNSG